MNDELKVRLTRGDYDNNSYLNRTVKDSLRRINKNMQISAIQSIIKAELSLIISPMYKGTYGIHVFNICNTIISNLDIPFLLTMEFNECIFKLMLQNEIFVAAVQSTAITDKDCGGYLLSLEPVIDNLISRIRELI